MPDLRVSVKGLVLVEKYCSVHIQLGGSSVWGNPFDTVNLSSVHQACPRPHNSVEHIFKHLRHTSQPCAPAKNVSESWGPSNGLQIIAYLHRYHAGCQINSMPIAL